MSQGNLEDIRYAPRVPRRLRNAVNRLCRKYRMPTWDVIRYSFEAAVLLVHARKLRLREPIGDPPLGAMITVRTSKTIRRMVNEIHERVTEDKRGSPEPPPQADVLRQLFEAILPIAEKRGMAHVMKLREEALR